MVFRLSPVCRFSPETLVNLTEGVLQHVHPFDSGSESVSTSYSDSIPRLRSRYRGGPVCCGRRTGWERKGDRGSGSHTRLNRGTPGSGRRSEGLLDSDDRSDSRLESPRNHRTTWSPSNPKDSNNQGNRTCLHETPEQRPSQGCRDSWIKPLSSSLPSFLIPFILDQEGLVKSSRSLTQSTPCVRRSKLGRLMLSMTLRKNV